MRLLLRAFVGAVLVVIIQLLARTKNYYIAGLVPLFPTFTVISHYVVGSQRTTDELKTTIRFGMLAFVPLLAYMMTLYLLVDRWRFVPSLVASLLCWLAIGAIMILAWSRWGG